MVPKSVGATTAATAAPSRLLIVLHGAVGDVTRALPLLCRLRHGLPQTEIYWAAEPAAEPLLRHHAALTRTVVFERQRGAVAFVHFLAAIRSLHADCVLDLQRHLKSGVVAVASGATRRIGFHRSNSREGNFLFQTEQLEPMPHFSSKLRQFLRFADRLGVAEAPVEFGIRLMPEEEDEARVSLERVPRPFAVLPVGSTCESRLWFPERTAKIVEWLAERGIASVLVGAVGEERYAAAIASECRTPTHDLVGRTTLRQLIAVTAQARVSVGPDSGPMHIAAALGIPVVSLWGATSAARSAPYGSEHLVVEGSAPCMPCYRKTCPIGRLCMQNISVVSVLEKVEAALG